MDRRGLFGVVAGLGLLLAVGSAEAADATAKRIMVYGDSNSWGFIPIEQGAPSSRYDEATRWPGVLKAALGPGYKEVNEALNGRTTDLPDPTLLQISGVGTLTKTDGMDGVHFTAAGQRAIGEGVAEKVRMIFR